jgi:hypothetical protein
MAELGLSHAEIMDMEFDELLAWHGEASRISARRAATGGCPWRT